MVEEKFSQKIRLKKIDETRNYSVEEIEQNELLSKKHKGVCRALRYNEHSLFFSFVNYWMYFHFCFCCSSLYSYVNYEFCNKIETCVITAAVKTYTSIIKKIKKKHDEIVLLTKLKLSSIKVLISNVLIDSNISHEEFCLKK